MNNIGKEITDDYCNGYFGREYDLSGSIIIAESEKYIVIKKYNGIIDFCTFQSYSWNRNEDGSLAGGISNLKCLDLKEKQKLIDSWCNNEL